MRNTPRRWKNKSVSWFLFLIALLADCSGIKVYALGYFYGGTLTTDNNITDPLLNPSRQHFATFERKNVGYIWGGEGSHSTETFRDIVPYFHAINMDTEKRTLSYSFVDNSRNYTNFTSGAAAVVDPTNGDLVLFFGGYRENRMNISEDAPIYIEQYDFISSQWTSITPIVAQSMSNQSIAISPPKNRAFASATATPDGNIYITGGVLTNVNNTVDPVIVWKYNPIHQMFTPAVSQDNTGVRGESLLKNIQGFVLENRQILYITGIIQSVYLFDPVKNSLVEQQTSGAEELYSRIALLSNGTSFQGPDKSIVYYWYAEIYSRDFAPLYMLNTSSWLWTPPAYADPDYTMTASWSHSHIANIYNDQYVILASGSLLGPSDMVIMNTANKNVSKVKEVSVVPERWTDDDPLSTAYYFLFFGYVLTCLLFVILSWWCWKKGLKTLAKKLYFWYMGNPRAGEPRWIEMSRLLTKLILNAVFWAYFAYNILMVKNSPKVELKTEQSNLTVLNPDVRLCFRGVLSANITASCSRVTASGKFSGCEESLNVPMFNKSKYYPYSTYKPPRSLVNCWFFTPHQFPSSVLTSSALQLSYEYTLDDTSPMHTLQIDLYNPYVPNPNVVTYLDYIPDYYGQNDPRELLETEEYIEWLQLEIGDDYYPIEVNNQYSLDLTDEERSRLTVNYKYQTRWELSDSTWNLVGLSPKYQELQEIISDFRINEIQNNPSNPAYVPSSSVITIQPTAYNNITIHEQRVYTPINALGSVGGLFAILVAIHTLLYGARPVSPYGIVHRYSPKKLKSSLQHALYDKFGFLERPIPLVHPVDQDFFYDKKRLMQKDHGFMAYVTVINEDKNQGSTSYSNAGDGHEALPIEAFNVQQKVYNKSEATTKLRKNMGTNNSTPSMSSGSSYLEGGFDQLRSELARQQEMYQLLKNDNETMKSKYNELQRRQQLMEVVLKAYYLDDEVLQELNKSHEVNNLVDINYRYDGSDISINMDTPEPPNTTLRSRVRAALQRPFRRRQQRQRNGNNDNCSTQQSPPVRYMQTPVIDAEEQLMLTNRSSDDSNETPSKESKDV